VSKAVKPVPHKVPLPTKVKPGTRQEFERLARRRGEGPSTYAAAVLEAHAQGLTFCIQCGFAHPVYHEERHGRN
jgi:hypothetical protein